MQHKEAIEDLMDQIQARTPHRMCPTCVMFYADIEGTDRHCWFEDASNKKNFEISLRDLTSEAGVKMAANCTVAGNVADVREIQRLAADSGSVDIED